MGELLRRYGELSGPARRFLGGALLLEISHAVLWTLQNLYVRSLGYGELEAGQVLAATAVGVVVSTFPSAWLYERIGPRRSLLISSAAVALGMAGLALSSWLPAMMFWAAVGGFAFTLHRVVSAPFLVAVSTPRERSHLFQAEFAATALALAAGPILAGTLARRLELGALAESEALRVTLLAAAGFALLAMFPYRKLPLSAGTGPASARNPLAILKPRNCHLWIRLCIPFFIIGVGAGLSIPFINLYFTDRFAMTKDAMGTVMAVQAGTLVVAAFLMPVVVLRLGMVRATVLSEALSLPFFVAMAFTTSLPIAIGAYVLRTTLMNLSHPIWRNLTMEITPPEWRTAVNSMSMLSWNLGWGLANVVGGTLIEQTAGLLGSGTDGYTTPMVITMGLYVLAIVLEALFFWGQRHIGQQLPRSAAAN